MVRSVAAGAWNQPVGWGTMATYAFPDAGFWCEPMIEPDPHPLADLTAEPPPVHWGVAIDDDAVERLARRWASTPMPLPAFDYPGTPPDRDENWWYTWAALAVSVLACLWPPDGEEMWRTERDGQWLDDAPGLFAAFTRARRQGRDLAWFATAPAADVRQLFAGRGTLQLLDERAATLAAAAAALEDRWDGNARHLVEEAGHDVTAMAALLTDTVPGYRDRPRTELGVLPFDKLPRLAAAIMASGIGWDRFTNYADAPVYPDYMLPRLFRHHGAMVYGPGLADLVDRHQLIPAESPPEHAIRWATVTTGARLRAALAREGNPVSGPALDYHLWSTAVLGPDAATLGAHHRTVTMRY
ncbi:MAG: queuosine salvage family protein [Acidimicrobiales bacterium]